MYKLGKILKIDDMDFALNENKRIDSILKEIKPYMIFIGDDNEEYVFLNYDDNKIYFCKDELCFCDKPDFINCLTGNFDTSYINMTRPEIFKSSYYKLSNERKVRRAINNIRLLLQGKPHNSKILQIGNIVKARSHSEEMDVDYEMIGLQIKLKSDIINKNKSNIKVVFSPIYIDIFGDYCPSSLKELFKGNDFNVPQTYVNDLGNKIIIEEILIKKEELQDIEFQF